MFSIISTEATLRNRTALTTVLASTLLLASSAFACPAANKVPNVICSTSVDVTILGDSIPNGYGDTKNGNKGGYVLRAQKALPQVRFHNHSVAGQRSRELIVQLTDAFEKNTSLKESLLKSSIVVIDEGRNDRWLFGTPAATYRNLKRARTIIKERVKASTGQAPVVIIAVMMLPNRGSQGPWVKELNGLILRHSTAKDPANLRLDLVSKRLLGSDQIHPTPDGYAALSKTLVAYLTKTLPPIVKKIQPDSDGDKLANIHETVKFGTNPNAADTDGDGKSDYEELFVTNTDPLVVD